MYKAISFVGAVIIVMVLASGALAGNQVLDFETNRWGTCGWGTYSTQKNFESSGGNPGACLFLKGISGIGCIEAFEDFIANGKCRSPKREEACTRRELVFARFSECKYLKGIPLSLSLSPISTKPSPTQEPVGLRVNLLQIRLDGTYSAAFLVNRTTIALQNRQNLSSPSLIFALIS